MSPLDFSESIQDVQALEEIYLDVQTRAAAFPAAGVRKAADYGRLIGASGIALAALEGFDEIKAGGPVTIDEVAKILGFPPDSPVGKLIALAERIPAQIKS